MLFQTVFLCIFIIGQANLVDLYKQLNIPLDAKGVLVFGQGSHLDWDWLNVFSTNVNNTPGDISGINYWVSGVREPSNDIFSQATTYLVDPSYRYSIAEVGFLQSFQSQHYDEFVSMCAAGDRFSIVGGGITSPDNLLPHGEAFIRNFVTGITWLNKYGIPWTRKVWIPDDFGHDSQLPVILQALGADGVGFSRLPGSCHQGSNSIPTGVQSTHKVIVNEQTGGLDFKWAANDGSEVLAYYEPTHYDTGDRISQPYAREYNSTNDARNCYQSAQPYTTIERFVCYLNVRIPVSATPMIFVTTGSDFAPPVPNLLSATNSWNSLSYPTSGIYAIAASFGHYQALVEAWLLENNVDLPVRYFHGDNPKNSFVTTPYWTGFYASRPILKILHYQATRTLIACEILNVIAQSLNITTGVQQVDIDLIWNDHAPSTHHDYVTGTSTDPVTDKEQVPLSTSVFNKAFSTRWQLMYSIGEAYAKVRKNASAKNPIVIVFNPHGFPVQGGVAVVDTSGSPPEEWGGAPQTLDGGQIVYVEAPPMGYKIQPLSNPPTNVPPVTLSEMGDTITLENGYLTAVISKDINWAIISLIDKATGQDILISGNQLEFRNDYGNIYRFGYEENCGFDKISVSSFPYPVVIVENSPLRVTVRADVRVSSRIFKDTNYTFEYSLIVGEPFLRMKLSGYAPFYTTIFTTFQFPINITGYLHGTPYHWDYKQPFAFGNKDDFKVTMEAVHDFIIPEGGGSTLAAIYHSASPAWGVLNNTLYGVVLRNTPEVSCANKGAAGSDSREYNIHYAIRVPTGLGTPLTGQPLRESRLYQSPLRALYLDQIQSTLPQEYSLMQLVEPTTALIMVVKQGTSERDKTFLRIYNPENRPNVIEVLMTSNIVKKSLLALTTALEEEGDYIPMDPDSGDGTRSFKFAAEWALSTLYVQ